MWIVNDSEFIEDQIRIEEKSAALALGLARAAQLGRYQIAFSEDEPGQILLYKNGRIEHQAPHPRAATFPGRSG